MDKQSSLNTNLINTGFALIVTSLIVYILIIGRSLILPMITAIVIWYLIIRLTAAFEKVPLTQIKLPFWFALILSLISTALVLYVFVTLITHSINGIIQDAPKYQEKLGELIGVINSLFKYKFNFGKLISQINFTSFFSDVALTITSLASSLTIIFVYVLFLLLEYKTFDAKLRVMTKNTDRYPKIRQTVDRISVNINTYMKVKTWASVLTAVLSYTVLFSFGINYAQFWAVLIFLLNFIPTIGSIVAIILTLLAVSIQFTTWPMFIVMAFLLIAIQFVVGNIVEPKFMGKNLNLSPLIIMLSLAFWGTVWGVLGMFLCVPLMTILNIILAGFDNTRPIAVLLAANPEIVN